MGDLKKGSTIALKIGGGASVVDKIGEGGQGAVYRVRYNNAEYALKWYTGTTPTDRLYKNLEELVAAKAPTASFLWPELLTEKMDGTFGYLMKMRPDGYRSFSDFLLAKAKFSSVNAMIHAAMNICQGFEVLHGSGYSYQDLNDGNFFINPLNGDVLICDNDNVSQYGMSSGIAGKSRYMAPEVVLGKKLPDAWTDRFSLSVILFLLFFGNHPLEGKSALSRPCLTEKIERELYGSKPVFILDPADDTNRPVRGVHANVIARWAHYPKFFHEAFVHSFSKERLTTPDKRMREIEWRKVLSRLRDETIICACGRELFYDADKASAKCACGAEMIHLPLLEINKSKIVLYPKSRIYDFHLSDTGHNTVIGELQKSKKDSGVWAIRNLSNTTWTAGMPGESDRQTVEPDKVMLIKRGLQISFHGGVKGNIL